MFGIPMIALVAGGFGLLIAAAIWVLRGTQPADPPQVDMLTADLPPPRPASTPPIATNLPAPRAIADIEMEYADFQGEVTTRRVLVQSIEGTATETDGLVSIERFAGVCLLRHAKRNFVVDRILTVREHGSQQWISDDDAIARMFLDIAHRARGAVGVTETRQATSPPTRGPRLEKAIEPGDLDEFEPLARNLAIGCTITHGFDGDLVPRAFLATDLYGRREREGLMLLRIVGRFPPDRVPRRVYASGIEELTPDGEAEPTHDPAGWLLWKAGLAATPPEPFPAGRRQTHRLPIPAAAVVEWERTPGDLEVFDVEIDEIEVLGETPVSFSCKARRRASATDRAWGGRRSFLLGNFDPPAMPIRSLRPSDAEPVVADPTAWMKSAIERHS